MFEKTTELKRARKKICHDCALGKPQKKVSFLMAAPLRGEEGGKGLAITFFTLFFYLKKKVPNAIELEGGKALMALPLRK